MFSCSRVLMSSCVFSRACAKRKNTKGLGDNKGKTIVFPWGDNRGVIRRGCGGNHQGGKEEGKGEGETVSHANRINVALMRVDAHENGRFWGCFRHWFCPKIRILWRSVRLSES